MVDHRQVLGKVLVLDLGQDRDRDNVLRLIASPNHNISLNRFVPSANPMDILSGLIRGHHLSSNSVPLPRVAQCQTSYPHFGEAHRVPQ